MDNKQELPKLILELLSQRLPDFQLQGKPQPLSGGLLKWVQFLTYAIKQGLPLQSIADTIFTYPTFSGIVKKAVTRYLRNKQITSPERQSQIINTQSR